MMSPLESVLIKKEKQFVNITHEREYIKGEWGFLSSHIPRIDNHQIEYLSFCVTSGNLGNAVQGFEWRSPGVMLAEGS
jgi:hypothetical protein